MTVKNKERGEGGDAVHSTSKSSMARPYKMPAQQANRSEAKICDENKHSCHLEMREFKRNTVNP